MHPTHTHTHTYGDREREREREKTDMRRPTLLSSVPSSDCHVFPPVLCLMLCSSQCNFLSRLH